MIHILLLILKIIGIIFLVLFALILLILFFPVTYKGNMEFHDNKAIGKATAGWLFHVRFPPLLFIVYVLFFRVYLIRGLLRVFVYHSGFVRRRR